MFHVGVFLVDPFVNCGGEFTEGANGDFCDEVFFLITDFINVVVVVVVDVNSGVVLTVAVEIHYVFLR